MLNNCNKMASTVAASHTYTSQDRIQTDLASQSERTPLLVESRGSVGGTIGLTLLCAIFGIGLVCGIYLILREDGNLDPPLNALVLQLVTRTEWGANETDIYNEKHLNLPVDSVLLLESNGPTCYNKNDCLNEMNVLQSMYLNHTKQSSFIANFLVGGDGRTYEGCGWTCKANYTTDSNTLAVGLIGTFQNRPPTELQITQIGVFVDYAIAEKELLECYTVTVHPEPDGKITFLTAVAEVLQKHALCDKSR